jgi:hypothetical protein
MARLPGAVICGVLAATAAVASTARAAAATPPVKAAGTSRVLQRATQSLADAVAPGRRAVWEYYTDPAFIYVTEDNEVKSRAQVLADLEPLPPGYSGWIVVEEFRCTDFGRFAVTTYVMNEHETVEGQELHARYRESDTWQATAGGWRLVAGQAYAIPLDPPRGALTDLQLAQYQGSYALSASTRQTIRRDGDHLLAERAGRAPQLLLPESGDVFFTPGRPRTRRIFTRAPDGHVSGFADRREGADLVWTRITAGSAVSH